jgi:glycerol kinase
MAQQYLLSIDQGTTGTTVSIISAKGAVKSRENTEFPQIFPKPGWVEHNPEAIWKSTVLTLTRALSKAKIKTTQIAAIGITNQRETIVAWDRRSGKTVGNAIVWQCRRTADICEALKKKGVEKTLHKTTGLYLDPYFSGTKMNWILTNRAGAKTLAQKGNLCFGTIDSFLIWKLTGGQVHATDVTNASRTQLMDLKSLQYSEDMMRVMGVKEEMLPQIHSSGGALGVTTKVAGLPSGIPIAGVLGDQQSALFGQQAFSAGEAKITYGTGSFLLMNTKNKKILSPHGLITTVAWQLPHHQDVDYALEGGAFICGAAVQWLRDNLGMISKSAEVEKWARKVTSSEGVQFVPSFSGLGAPHWDPHVQGAMFGITRGTRREHLAYATLEAMALQNVDVVNTMIKDSKVKLKAVRVDGGAAANDLLMQMQADFLGVKAQRPQNTETTSMGAALMAGLGVGLWSDLKELKKMDIIEKQFKPKMTTLNRKKRLQRWHKAIMAIENYHH